MDNIDNQNKQQEDLIQDPNLLLAVAMVKSISSLIDNNSGSSDDNANVLAGEGAQKIKAENSATQVQPQKDNPVEKIELTPLEDLVDKLKQKRLFTKEELNVITNCITNKFGDFQSIFDRIQSTIDYTVSEAVKIREMLTIAYYAIVNAHTYSQGSNYIELSYYQRLCKEILNLVKKILEVLSKKDQDVHLYNETIPIIMKLLTVFHTRVDFDQAHYSYLKTSQKFDTYHLSYLNPYLVEVAPALYAPQKPKTLKQEEAIIALPQNQTFTEDDPLDKVLEYVPMDYSTLTSMLQQHMQQKLSGDEAMSLSDPEEEAKSASSEKDIVDVCKEHISKLKILELATKSIDQIAVLSENLDHFSLLNTDIINQAALNSEHLNLKLKKLPQFITKTTLEKCQAAQASIINQLSQKAVHSMEVDQSDELFQIDTSSTKIDNNVLREQLIILAKNLDIMKKSLSNSHYQSKIEQNFEILISESNDIKFMSTLSKLDKKILKTVDSFMLSIINSIIFYMVRQFKAHKLSQDKFSQAMLIASTFVKAANKLNELTTSTVKKSDPKDSKQKPISASLPTITQKESKSATYIRTRNQLKKNEDTSNVQKESHSQKQRKESPHKKSTHVEIKQYDCQEILKHALGFLIMILPTFLNQTQVHLQPRLIKNLFAISYFPSALTYRIIYGILTEFTKSSVVYANVTQTTIVECLLKKLDTILASNCSTVFALKLLFHFKDSELSVRIIEQLTQNSQWQTNKKAPIKQLSEIYEITNLNKYFLLVSCILMMQETDKKKVLDILFQNINMGVQYFLSLHIAQLLFLSALSLNKLKPIIFTFLTKLYQDNEPNTSIIPLIAELDKAVLSIFTSKGSIYNRELLAQFENQLQLTQLISSTRLHYLPLIKDLDQKLFVLPLIKHLIRLTSELNTNEVQNSPEQYQELYSKISQSSTAFLLNSEFERLSRSVAQPLIIKLSYGSTELTNDELNFIQTQAFLLKHTSKLIMDQQVQILQNFIEGGYADYAQVLIEFAKLTNVAIKSKLQPNLIFVSNEDNKVAQMIIDPIMMVKNLAGLSSNKIEDNVYAHVMSQSGHRNYQTLISCMLLAKSVFENLFLIITSCGQEQLKEMVREISITLLQVKYDNPYLEYQENNCTFDHELNDKILQKSGALNLANRDFMRIRQFDYSIHCIQVARTQYEALLNNSIQHFALDQRKFILQLLTEVASNISAALFKGADDYKLLNDYLSGVNQNENTVFFQSVMKNNQTQEIGFILWDNAFRFLTFSLMDQDSDINSIQEKKGGVQLTITFEKKPSRAAKTSARRSATKSSNVKSEVQEPTPVKRTPTINVISQKLLQFLSDMIGDKGDQTTDDSRKIGLYLKESFLAITNQADDFISIMHQVSQLPLLRRVLSTLVSNSNSNPQLRQSIQEKIYHIINQVLIKNPSEELIILCIELSQLITESNKQLLQYITSEILPRTFDNSTAKLVILDFLCQLGQSKYSKVENDNIKYSVLQIQELRKKIQQDKVNKKKQRTDSQEDKKQIDTKSSDSNIEGYRTDKLNKEQDYQRFMEKPEDVCTFSYTQKDFKQQHWYFCYTCGLNGNDGCCAVCARKCHKGHHVVYSRKSNFFCDCGASGKCTSLSAEAQQRPQTSKKRLREDSGTGLPPREPTALSNIFGMPQSASRLFPPSSKFDMQEEDEDDESAIIYKHIGGMIDQPPSFLKMAARANAGQLQFLSESSEEDMIMREENEDEDLRNEDQQLNAFKNVKEFMRFIKQVPPKMAANETHVKPQNNQSELSQSQISHIDPLDDPLSEPVSTPVNKQGFMSDRKDSFANLAQQDIDTANVDEIQMASEIADLIQQEQGHFDKVYTYLLELIEGYLTEQNDMDEPMSAFSSPKRAQSIRNITLPKQSVTLISDLTSCKKTFKELTFNTKLSEQTKAVTQNDLNLQSVIDCNKNGLVAICEEQEVSLYAGSQFFDDQPNTFYEQFNFQTKEGSAINKVESVKLSFQPVVIKFNPNQQQFLCAAGTQNVEVLTVNNQGKVVSRLAVDLLLEVISKDLTIVNVHWLPGSQTLLAVGTREFIKIYDLSEDNISPSHNLMIFSGFISDFTFTKERFDPINPNKLKTTVYVASKSGAIYHQEITYNVGLNKDTAPKNDEMMQYEDNSELMLTKTLKIDATFQFNETSALHSIYYSALTDLLFITVYGGTLMAGKVDNDSNYSGFKINPSDDPTFIGSNFKNLYQKYGDNIVQIKDLGSQKNKHFLYAVSKKIGNSNSGVPIIIEISENNVDINVIKNHNAGSNINPVIGVTYVKHSHKNSNSLRLVTISNDGSAGCHVVVPLQTESRVAEFNFRSMSTDKLLHRSDLPKEVKLSVNFFEKMKNVYNDPTLKTKLSFSGDLIHYFKNSKATFEHLSKASAAPIINEAAKKNIKFSVKLDQSSDHALTGFRVRMEHIKTSTPVQLKLFNRTLKLKTVVNGLWFDIPFCDAEIIFGTIQNIEIELVTEDVRNCPIKIYGMEFYAMSRKEFQYREKIKKLEKINEASGVSSGCDLSSEDQIRSEMLGTKSAPMVTWKEKMGYLRQHTDDKNIQLVEALDIITQYTGLIQKLDISIFQNLIDKLKFILKRSLYDVSDQNAILLTAVKRCLRKILAIANPQAIIGDPLNYQTIKDQILIQVINERLENYDLKFEEVRNYINGLHQIYQKRQYQLFKIIESYPDLITILIKSFLRLYKQFEKDTTSDVCNIVSLTLASYQQMVNSSVDLNAILNIGDLIKQIYGNQSLQKPFEIIELLINSNEEQIQKVVISTLLKLFNSYAHTMAKILKYNKLPQMLYNDNSTSIKVSVIFIDFGPHLLSYLLNQFKSYQGQGDLIYALTYKTIKQFDQNCTKYYSSYYDFSSILSDLITHFVKNILTTVTGDAVLYDNSHQQNAQELYINLILTNILLQGQNPTSHLKIKGSNLSLDKKIQEQVISNLMNDSQSAQKLAEWSISLLNMYSQGFTQGKCSYRVQMDEGMVGKIYEAQIGNNSGSHGTKFLRPIQETAQWKWSPLFIHTDGLFEHLDRKIPAQLLLSIQFFMSYLSISEDTRNQLINSIKDLAFKKPAKTFLKNLGEESIRQILIKSKQSNKFEDVVNDALKEEVENQLQSNIKGSVAFQEFFQQFEGIYYKFIQKKQSMSYNMQFTLHSMLQKAWKKASFAVKNWNQFIIESKVPILKILFESSFTLNEDSALLTMSLCALSFETQDLGTSSMVHSYKGLLKEQHINLFSVFKTQDIQNTEQLSRIDVSGITISHSQQYVFQMVEIHKLVDVMLLGRNKRQLRMAAAHILKGIYDTLFAQNNSQQLSQYLLSKIQSLQAYGVNSIEYISVLSYIVNNEFKASKMIDSQTQLVSKIFSEIQQSNKQLTAHPNLEVYATLQRITSAFSHSKYIEHDEEKKMQVENPKDPNTIFLNKSAYSDLFSHAQAAHKNKKITNPYLLESEACSKCYEQKSLPYTAHRLNDIKSEAKFTDSSMIFKFITTYQIKQLVLNQEGFRGNKVIKTMNVYVNNKQGVDLADMKNNWNLWKKVKSVEVDPGQRLVTIDFTLPINVTNLLLEFQTINLPKPFTGKEKTQQTKLDEKCESLNQISGLDTVLMTLPKKIAMKLGVNINSKSSEEASGNGSILDKENMVCPRCGKQVQGKHGICNACGENALQCTFCRNINYEKPDGFLCNECGFSRFVKMELSLSVKQGFACEKIESEDVKNQALNQIEQQLQQAQSNYSLLMKKRQMIAVIVKKINEGSENANARIVQDIYNEECAEYYQKMMKALYSIKILKIEIDSFTQGSSSSQDSQDNQSQVKLQREVSSTEGHQQQCFSCISEYLKANLGFVEATSHQLSQQYKDQGFLDLLFNQNIKMHSSSLQEPARMAICSILENDQVKCLELLSFLESQLFKKIDSTPAHQLSANIAQESELLLDILEQQIQLQRQSKPNFYKQVFSSFWGMLFKGLIEGQSNAAIADQVVGSFFKYLKELIKVPKQNQEQPPDDIASSILSALGSLFGDSIVQSDIFGADLQKYLNNKNFLIEALTIQSSARARDEAKDIILYLATEDKLLQPKILKALLLIINQVLNTNTCDQYFDIIQHLLGPTIIKDKITEESLKPDSDSHIYVESFERLFKQIDNELNKLVIQEQKRQNLGHDGFMPQISTGQILSRLVTLISTMIKESSMLKHIIQRNVNIVIKSFLKIRKLNLTKNKMVQNSEIEIEKMFKELHSEKEDDKDSFIVECIMIIESGECDYQEMRFLFEEICKVIDPVKPDPEYLLNLNKAQSQEFYFRGKMSKNPYTSSQLGKTMADARLKICKEMELAEPELVELLVAGKIVGMDLTIRQVYEQVYWPALCKQRNPDIYDIPNIDEAPKASLTAMNVTFRLMGIDGEATEDRVETLQDGTESDQNPAALEKKYGITQILQKDFQSKQHPGTTTNGIKVLLSVLENFGSLQKQRYLAEWLLKLIGFSIKVKTNRQEFVKHKQTVDLFAKRMFESVGMQSQIEGQKGMTLFDVTLVILEQIIVEVNLSDDQEVSSLERMDIDSRHENIEAATHVEIFIQILTDSCNEMHVNHQGLDKTSKKIKAVSKILPFLINQEDHSAIGIIIDFIVEALKQIPHLDLPQNSTTWTNKQKFAASFNLDRLVEILESTPAQKNFLKDKITEYDHGQTLNDIYNFLNDTLADITSEQKVFQHKLANQYMLKFLNGLLKNHPLSQRTLQDHRILDKLYHLTQSKFKDKSITILAQDIIENLTNKQHTNDQQVKDYLQKLIDQQNEDKKKLAQKKKEEIMRQMQQKKNQNKFMKQIDNQNMQEETGPKCIVCLEGYTKKPTEVLGMYAFTKKIKISELSTNGSGFVNTHGYTTVTHSNFIHFVCHQNAYRADSQLRQPKKEWEGAVIRNDHTKCNILFPMKGGTLPEDSYSLIVEKHFQTLVKTVGQCDSDKVKVMIHDFKMVLKRLAYEDSFSRDTHGGGPEHNMHMIPFMIQMTHYLLTVKANYYMNTTDVNKQFTYLQENRIKDFLESGMKLKKDFMSKLEEEKKADEIEEEEKFSEDMSHSLPEEEEDTEANQLSNMSLDQIAYYLTSCLVFCQIPRWEDYKFNFLSIILCTVASIREEKDLTQPKPTVQQTDYATGKKILTISKQDDVQMASDSDQILTGSARRRRLSSDNKIEQIQRALTRLRPLLVLMRIVDSLKQRWDAKRLGINETTPEVKQDAYLKRLVSEVLSKGNLQEVISDCDDLFKEYKDRMLKLGSVEEFLQDMGMIERIIQEHSSVEQYVLSHF